MNRTLIIGIVINILGLVLMIKGIFATPVNWILIVLGLITWVPAGYVIMVGMWRL